MKAAQVATGAIAVVLSFALGLWSRPEPRAAATPAVVPPSPGAAASPPAAEPVITFFDTSARRATPILSGPQRLDAMEAQAMGVEPEELYEAQGRDDAWASSVEAFYLEHYGAFLRAALGEVAELRATCKESMCEISFQVPVAEEERAYRRQQYMPTGSLWKPFSREAEKDGFVTVGVLVTLGDEVRDPAMLEQFYRRHRDERFPPGKDIATILAEWERQDLP
jgi:hypothetical protein